MRLDLEQQFIKRFVLKTKQDRYLGFIESPKRRQAFLEMLYHGQDLNKRLFQDLRGGVHESYAIRNKVNSLKNGDKCYIISVNKELDGREMSLTDALAHVVGREGNLIIFGEVEAVYYEGEAPYNRYLSL